MTEVKPLDSQDSVTFNPVEKEPEPEKKSAKQLELEQKWKDEYALIGDRELKQIVATANEMTDHFKFTDKERLYTPIGNKLWREMVRVRREWSTTSEKDLDKGETMMFDYYAKMCEIYYGMSRDEYDVLPPAETQLAVEAANYKTQHPLEGRRQSGTGSTQSKENTRTST